MKQFLLKAIMLVVLGFWGTGLFGQAPIITSLNPVNGATGVAVNQVLSITFDRDVQFGFGEIGIWRYSDDVGFQFFLTDFDPEVSIVGNTLYITHNNFDNSTQYYITIEPGSIQSLNGDDFEGFSNKSIWNFSTISLATAPIVTSFDPIPGSVGVARDKTFKLEFDQAIIFGTGSILIRRYDTGQTLHNFKVQDLPLQISITGGNSLEINHDLLLEGVKYYVLIQSGAIKSAIGGLNFAGILNKDEWSFTTILPPVPPLATTYNPINGATNVSNDQILSISFDQNIELGIGDIEIRRGDGSLFQYILADEGNSDPELTIIGNQLFINHGLFENGTEYYVTISDGAIRSSENVLNYAGFTSSTHWRFTSAYPVVPPQVVSLDPVNGANGVLINKTLEITFDQNIKLGSGDIEIRRFSDGSLFQYILIEEDFSDPEVSVTGNKLMITHANFLNGTQYYITISSGAILSLSDQAFAGFSDNSYWSFTTESAAMPPVPLSFTPSNGATNVALDQILSIEFDQPIQKGTGSIRIRNLVGGGIYQTIAVTDPLVIIDGNTLHIAHNDLLPGTGYYVTIANAAILSLQGIAYSGINDNSSWNFTTTQVGAAPIVTAFDPVNGAIGVPIDKVLTITFDQNIQLADGEILIKRYSDDSNFSTLVADWTSSDAELIVSANELSIIDNLFEEGVRYYVTISNGAIQSLAGDNFSGISDKDTWYFTSVGGPEPPFIIEDGLSPAPGSVDVGLNENLILTFNEEVQRGSGFMTIYIAGGADFASLSASSSNLVFNGNQVTITHPPFSYNTDYYVIIPSGFIRSSNGVDFPGITTSDVWYFETQRTPPVWIQQPFISDQNLSSMTLNGELDQDGFYYFVVTSLPTQPTSQQIEAGLNSQGETAVTSGSGSLIANELFNHAGIDISGLSEIDHYLHIVAKVGSVYTERVILVVDRTAPVLLNSSIPEEDEMTVDINVQIILNFNEKLYRLGTEITNDNINSLGIIYLRNNGSSVPFAGSISPDGRSLIIVPVEPLLENSDYQIEVYRLEDVHENMQGQRNYRNFQTDKLNRWIGGGDPTVWNDPLNWQDIYVAYKSVLIPAGISNYPVINSGTINVHNLTIEAGASLTQTGGTINITGNFNLRSSATVNASYIKTGGSLNVDNSRVRIEQVVSDPNVTYFFAAPVTGATPNSIQTTNVVYQFNNSTGQYATVSGNSSLTPGRGYATRSTQPLVFRGAVNQGNIDFSVFRSTAGFGWNLVGNPYPASIDWTALTNVNLEDAFWIWNQDGGNYGVYNAGIVTNHLNGPVIPSSQAFLVKVLLEQTSGTVGFNMGAQVKNEYSYLKSSVKTSVTPHIKLAGINGVFNDEVAFAVTQNASYGIDRLDTEKYFSSTSGLFELYSQVGNMSTVISSYPTDETIEIPLGYKAKSAGNYKIQLTKNLLPGYKIILMDITKGQQVDITEGGTYDFSITSAGSNISRFKLMLIQQSTATNKLSDKESVTIFVKDGTLFVEINRSEGLSNFNLYDLNGRFLRRGKLMKGELNRIEGMEKGVYILEIINGNDSSTNHKVVIN